MNKSKPYLTLRQMANELGLKRGALKMRIYRGASIPPYVKMGSAPNSPIIFYQDEYETWCAQIRRDRC